MDPNQQEQRIKQLETQVAGLTNLLSSILQGSTATKIYFRNQVQFDLLSQVGFFGAQPAKKQTIAATATDAATTQTLANSIRTILITFGLAQ